MYAQLVETGVKRVKSLEEMSPEERNFQERSTPKSRSKPRTGCPRPTARP